MNIIDLNSGCTLVPFDVLGNGVTLRSGNSSHWGVISGYELNSERLYVQHSQNLKGFECEYELLKESNNQLYECGRKYKDKVAETGEMDLKGNCLLLLNSAL